MGRKKKPSLIIKDEMDLNEKVRHLYMLYFNPQEIAVLCQITQFEVTQLVAELNLKEERQKLGADYISKCVASHLSGFEDIIKLSVENLRRFLLDMTENEQPMSVKDAKMLGDLVHNVHRMSQLEKQLPTSISKNTGATVKDVNEALKEALEELRAVDPFVTYDSTAPDKGDGPKLN